MTRRFCPNCGAALEFSFQKFCTRCGADVPGQLQTAALSAPARGPVTRAGLPVFAAVAAILLLLGAGTMILLPYLAPPSGTSSTGPASGAEGASLLPSPTETPLQGVTPITTTDIPVMTGVSETAPPTISAVPTPVPSIPILTRTTSPPTITAVQTRVYDAEPTTMITAAMTQIPAQPPESSYISETPGAPFIDPSALEDRIHNLINEKRQQNGLAPLASDLFLADIARGHSWDMVTRNFFAHENPDGKTPGGRGDAAGYPCIRYIRPYVYEGIAENLYQGNRASSYYTNASGGITGYDWMSLEDIAQSAVNGWMNSPGHRKNILTEHFSIEGIGVSFAPDNKIYVTENFC